VRTRCPGKAEPTVEVSYAITSVPRSQASAKTCLDWWRGHWDIENRLHYVRDVTMAEDANQIAMGHAPQNLAALRNALLNLLRLRGHENIAAAMRACTWQTSRTLAYLGIMNQ
jgi:hypothetical protein